MEEKFRFEFSINFDEKYLAVIVYQSLYPEVQEHSFERSKIYLELKEKIIVVKINARDLIAAKASINSILRWISATTESLMAITTIE